MSPDLPQRHSYFVPNRTSINFCRRSSRTSPRGASRLVDQKLVWHLISLGALGPHFYGSRNCWNKRKALLLKVKYRDTLIGVNEICKVLSFTRGSRDPDSPTLFQSSNVDRGEIKHFHAAEVKEIVTTYEQEVKQRLESPTYIELLD